ncbi:TM0106 family RecB-like putative nuclease [Synechococcus sp. LA31]|uniref:TM0106 family RecB-like putative nuclease n=1 Tax=Synechococcus sp. LA31 TaxID=2741953 RepID=UPI001BDD9CE0|nr:TM0106 family RecB-like putative nuclease [Synechococcus sp. LA31]QVV67995.1 TM0106 family RecB-like putative nuclease [Synechococcus sp. LA31]
MSRITPSKLSLFSRSPVIGAWWEELEARGLFQESKPEPSALDQQLFADGLRHEQVLLSKLEAQGHRIARLPGKQNDADYTTTRAAMAEGFDFIHQASLCNDELRGSADLLRRIEQPSGLGSWSYIPIECKLASKPKTTFLVQASAYCELLTALLGQRPDHFELYLGGGRFQRYATDQFWAWYQLLRQRYRSFRATFDPQAVPEDMPGDHAGWTAFIDQRLADQGDLMLVANMRQSQRQKLRAAGIATIDDLAALPAGTAVPGLNPEALHELRQQAELQLTPAAPDGRPAYRLRPVIKGKGLAALPAADDGDIWFDMEGIQDSVAGTKLEYLFGACYRDIPGGPPQFKAWWAHSPLEEKKAFEAWVDWVEDRRSRYPGLRVYHYASYEKTAMRRLAQQHCTREAVIDEWLRSGLLVDLLPVVTGSIVLGEPSYSIKKVEHLYMEKRAAEVTNAGDSVVAYLNWQNSGEPNHPGALPDGSPLLQGIENYNKEDCESTVFLHDWLRGLRRERGLPENPLETASDEKPQKEPWPLGQLSAELLGELPEALQSDPGPTGSDERLVAQEQRGPRGLSWRVQRLLAQLLPFHHREAKVAWWAYFDRRNKAELSPSDLIDDSESIAEARWRSVQARESKRTGADYHTFSFDPSQPLKIGARDADRSPQLEIADTGLKLDIDALDAERGRITLKLPWSKRDQRRSEGLGDGIPDQLCSLIAVPADITEKLRDSLLEQAKAWHSGASPIPQAMVQLLERQTLPELKPLNAAVAADPSGVAARLADFLANRSGCTLALQGPPGTGKTTVTGQVIADLVARGKRVAISSNGHAAINNLLIKAKYTCAERGLSGAVVKCNTSKKEESLTGKGIPLVHPDGITPAMAVVGGTAWMFAREVLADQFDLLVVDEAGQMSLANLLVMARCARSILLVGDQQQLAQPSQADHPGSSGDSCLEYLMQGAHVVPPDQGVFLSTSWRMEPSITAVVSELFYDGRLQASSANAVNAIQWARPCLTASGRALPDRGMVFEAVHHSGCSVTSEAEIERIDEIVAALLGGSYTHAKGSGRLSSEEILVIAPYNVQVNRLRQRLDGKARVGTVDKFQGQEAPVAILSLTASSGDDAPRGLGFLLSPNRLNVAISRAQCLSIVVGCPGLTSGLANTIEEAEQINRLCRIIQSSET